MIIISNEFMNIVLNRGEVCLKIGKLSYFFSALRSALATDNSKFGRGKRIMNS